MRGKGITKEGRKVLRCLPWRARPGFAHYYLMRLGIGHNLKRVDLNSQFPYQLSSVEEVLALRPELRPPE